MLSFSCLYILFTFNIIYQLQQSQALTTLHPNETHTITASYQIKNNPHETATMRSTTLFLGLGFTMAVNVSAAPLSELAPSTRPLFTPVCCSVHASNATGVANVTSGESPNHTHTPDCEHNSDGKQDITETKGHATEGKDHTAEVVGNPSPYPAFNATDYPHPHSDQAHNHTSEYCSHPSHHNTTSTGATHDTITHPKMLNTSAESTHNHTGNHCTHPIHYKGTIPTGHSYNKKSVSPRVDVTVCLGADCQESEVVTANVNSAGDLTGINVKNSKRMVKGQDREISYEDIARQMSGARIAGGM